MVMAWGQYVARIWAMSSALGSRATMWAHLDQWSLLWPTLRDDGQEAHPVLKEGATWGFTVRCGVYTIA